jgi:hypothetical protein
LAFESQVVRLTLSDILPMKRVSDSIKQTASYKRIKSPQSAKSVSSNHWSSPATRGETGPHMLVDAACGMLRRWTLARAVHLA